MSRLPCRLAGGLLALVLSMAAGCMPRGPFPVATLFGETEGPECCRSGSCGRHRAGHHGRAEIEGNDANPSSLSAPISNFHPVPTRPVFTPWLVEESQAEEIAGPLAWRQALNRAASVKPDDLPPGEERSSTPIARRTLPPPANLPDDKPLAPSPEKRESDQRGERSNSDWHAAGP
jgi:hypothetical protein